MTAMAVMSSAAATSRVGVRVGQGTKARNSASARGTQAHASAAGTQAFFSSWTHDSTQQLPERVQDYLSLLAESSTTGNMQKHLVKLMVKGAGAAVKAGGAALNPMDALTDVVAGAGTDFFMSQVTTPNGGWSKLRQAVLGTSAFKSAGRTRDDSYTPPPAVDPRHAKALGVLVSVLMSGAGSGAAHAMPEMPAMQNTMHAGVEMTQSVSVVSKFEHAGSLRAAPSFVLRADSGAELVGSGGMAASTALKLLRADSKVADTLPDLKDIFSSAMTSIEEECEGNAIEKLSAQPRGRPGFGAGFGGGGVRSGAPTA